MSRFPHLSSGLMRRYRSGVVELYMHDNSIVIRVCAFLESQNNKFELRVRKVGWPMAASCVQHTLFEVQCTSRQVVFMVYRRPTVVLRALAIARNDYHVDSDRAGSLQLSHALNHCMRCLKHRLPPLRVSAHATWYGSPSSVHSVGESTSTVTRKTTRPAPWVSMSSTES